MQRRSFIKNSCTVLATLALFSNKTIAQFLADPTWTIKMLTADIGVFTEKGGTIMFMLSKEGIVVVDAQFPETSQHLIDELKKKSDQPFRLLINTHHHGDHTAGNILQLKTPDALRGRVMSVNSMFINSSNEIGQFESGVSAKLMGVVPSVVFGGCMTIAVVVATWFKAPSLKKLEY
jgi:hypothetical protein